MLKVKKHKNGKNVLNWVIRVPEWPTGGMYTHPALKIPILNHTDIFLQFLCFFTRNRILYVGYNCSFFVLIKSKLFGCLNVRRCSNFFRNGITLNPWTLHSERTLLSCKLRILKIIIFHFLHMPKSYDLTHFKAQIIMFENK